MAVLLAILVLVLLGVVVLVVGAPLRRARTRGAGRDAGDVHRAELDASRRDELEAAREAKYREIRDAEMDYRTGKLSELDYRVLDGELRAEALAILDGLQDQGGRSDDGGQPAER